MKRPIKIETVSLFIRLNRYLLKTAASLQTVPTHCQQVLFALGFFVLCSIAQAVVPAPDGGYPGGNTAEGQNALLSLTTGTYNAAIGVFSLESNAAGSFNTALGAGTLLANTADQNTATGAGALLSNTTGVVNTANGAFALFSNTTGFQNTANGAGSLLNNTTGNYNTALGLGALEGNTTADNNTALGINTLLLNTQGLENTACGGNALLSNTTGDDNAANGFNALFSNTTGVGNTAIGVSALYNNTNGGSNTAIGLDAGVSITGDGNVCIGASVSGGAGENNTTRIRNIGSTPIVGGTNVVILGTGGDGDGTLGYASSSRRYKEDIKPMDKASETLFALKPVTFQAKGDTRHVKHYGLIAEDVAMVDPDLAVYNPEGKPETLRFDSINAMVLNEFLKEHRKLEEQQATITQLRSDAAKQEATVSQLRKEMEVFAATLKEQAAQVQKVSAQLEVSKFATGRIRRGGPAPQVVLKNP
jgi:hypothetical protein